MAFFLTKMTLGHVYLYNQQRNLHANNKSTRYFKIANIYLKQCLQVHAHKLLHISHVPEVRP